MSKKALLAFLFSGGLIGAGTGLAMKPGLASVCLFQSFCNDEEDNSHESNENEADGAFYTSLKNQFVVPVVHEEVVKSLVVLSLSLELQADESEAVFAREPKLRDAFLQVLFDHAHIGGFDGAFTESGRLSALKVALLEAAQSVMGLVVSDVIVTDIVRQEM